MASPTSSSAHDGDVFVNSLTARIEGEVDLRVEICHLERIISQKTKEINATGRMGPDTFLEAKLASRRRDQEQVDQLRAKLANFQAKSKTDLKKSCSQLLAVAKSESGAASTSTSAPSQGPLAKFEAYIESATKRERDVSIQLEAMIARLNAVENARSAMEKENQRLQDQLVEQRQEYSESIASLASNTGKPTSQENPHPITLTVTNQDLISLKEDCLEQKQAIDALTESHRNLVNQYEGTEGTVRAIDDHLGNLDAATEKAASEFASQSQAINRLQSEVTELEKRADSVEDQADVVKDKTEALKSQNPQPEDIVMTNGSDSHTVATESAPDVKHELSMIRADMKTLRSTVSRIVAHVNAAPDKEKLKSVAAEVKDLSQQYEALEAHFMALKTSYNNLQTSTLYRHIVDEMCKRIPAGRINDLEHRIASIERGVREVQRDGAQLNGPSPSARATGTGASARRASNQQSSSGSNSPSIQTTQGPTAQTTGPQTQTRPSSTAPLQRAQQPTPSSSVQPQTTPQAILPSQQNLSSSASSANPSNPPVAQRGPNPPRGQAPRPPPPRQSSGRQLPPSSGPS